jgi:PAS domain S-box-containing protein
MALIRLREFWAERGLLLRVAIGQGLLLAFLAVSMSALLAYGHRKELIEERQNRAHMLMRVLAPLVAEYAVVGDYASIKQLLERQATVYPDVSRLHWSRNGMVAVTVDVPPSAHVTPAWFQLLTTISPMQMSGPVAMGGVHYGELRIAFDAAYTEHHLWQEITGQALHIFVSAALLLGAMLLVMRSNLRVLREIARAVDRFRQGEYAVRIRPTGSREMRQASDTFNNMAERIQQLLADVSDSRRKLNEQLHFIEELIEALPVPMFYKNRQGYYLGVNAAWEGFFGMRRTEIVGKTVNELYPWQPEIAAMHERKDAELFAHPGVQTYEINLRNGRGEPRLVMYNKTTLTNADGEVTGLLGLITDLTELQEAEQKVRQALVDKAAAEQASQAKSLFLANMSHEIRTPLNAVLGLAQVGMRGNKGRKSRDTFGRILEAGQLLLSVVNDVLDFSKIEAGKLTIETAPFSLGETVDRVVEINAARAFAKGLDFRVHEAADFPEAVVGDEMHLAQILINLLGNAVKFTDQGRVSLTVHRAEGASGLPGLRFEIADSGIGMTEEQMANLFQPFEQADGSTTRRFGGTGLGLSISQRLALAMGGEIGVSSQPGEGSVFSLWLPLAAEPTPERPFGWRRFALVNCPPASVALLREELSAKSIESTELAAEQVLAGQAWDLVVVAVDAVAQPAVASMLEAALQAGQRVAVVVMPGAIHVLPGSLQERVALIERPVRARHLIAASQRPVVPFQAPLRRSGGRLQGLRILAAEDNEVNQIVLQEILDQEGARLALAGNGREALECVQQKGGDAFDLLLTDVQMPVMDGYDLAREVSRLFPNLPIVGLTAHAMPEERERCLAAGMREHVAKPIDIEILVAAILRHLPPEAATRIAALAAEQVPAQAELALEPAAGTAAVEAPAAAKAVSETGVVDWPALGQFFKGKMTAVERVVEMALANNGDTPTQLRELAGQGDLPALASLGHKLKGMAGSLRAPQVHGLAAQTEASARAGQAEAADLARQLAEAMETLLAELARWRAGQG